MGKIKELEYELGRYKKAVTTRDQTISELREEIAGHQEIANIVAAFMKLYIDEKGGKVRVPRKEIAKNLGDGRRMECTADEEEDMYVISLIDVDH